MKNDIKKQTVLFKVVQGIVLSSFMGIIIHHD